MDLKEEGVITMDEDGEEDEDEEAEDQEPRAAQDQGQDIEMVSGDPKNVQVALAAKGPTVEQEQEQEREKRKYLHIKTRQKGYATLLISC